MQYLHQKIERVFLIPAQKVEKLSLFSVALYVADMGGDLHGSVWFWPEAVVDCAVQRGLNILDQ